MAEPALCLRAQSAADRPDTVHDKRERHGTCDRSAKSLHEDLDYVPLVGSKIPARFSSPEENVLPHRRL